MAIDPNWVRENPEEAARQIELMTREREQHQAAEEAQIALRQKAEEERDALAAYQADMVRELTACQAVLHSLAHDGQVTPEYAIDAKAVLKRVPRVSLARRDAEKKAEALEEAANETVPAMHKMANWLRARAAEERRKAEGGA